jgi:hypothetical protein
LIDNDEVLAQTLASYLENDRNQRKTAEALGIARSTLQARLKRISQLGQFTNFAELPPGFILDRVTIHANKDGPVQEWVKLKGDAVSYEEAVHAIEAALTDRIPALPVDPISIQHTNADLVTFYLIIDHHLGLYSWEAETGANYDLTIAQRDLRNSYRSLVAVTPPSSKAIILNVGDFFHSDDNTNRTRRSGNVLDADGRYAKILEIGVDLEISAIELALTKHETVEVRNLPGNHDPYASIALNTGIRMAFRNNPRVHVSRDPSPFYFFRHGKVLVASTHGDMIRATDMPSVVAAYAPKDWGETEHRYIYLGHVHHASVGGGERYGATWETFRTLAAKDAWAAQSGYASGRSMVAITHHKEYGEVLRNTVTISGPGFKKGL